MSAPVPAQTTSSTLDRLRQTHTLRIAYRVDAPPFSMKVGTGDPSGYSVDLCRAVAAALPAIANVPALTVTYVPVTAADRFDAIRDGRADLLCDSTSATLARRKLVDFSISTFVDGAGLLVRDPSINNLTLLAGKSVTVVEGTTTQQALLNSLKAGNIAATVVPAKSYADALHLLDTGAVAAFFGDHSVLLYLLPQSSAPDKLKLADNYLTVEPYALALHHGDEDFRLAVDTALSRIYRSGQMAQLYGATFGRTTIDATLVLFYAISSYPD